MAASGPSPRLLTRIDELGSFAALDDASRELLVAELEETRIEAGATLLAEGDAADCMYVLLDGALSVAVEADGVPATLGPGAVVGEIALVAGGTRSATVTASEASTVAVLRADRFAQLADANPSIGAHFSRLAVARLRRDQLRRHLSHLLPGFGRDSLEALEKVMRWRIVPAGEVLYAVGDVDEHVHLLVFGRLSRERPLDDAADPAQIVPGQFAGEQSLMVSEPRDETVSAVRDCEVASLSIADFEALAGSEPRLAIALMRRIGARRNAGRPQAGVDERCSIAFVGLDAGIDLGAAIVRDLADKLAQLGSVIHVSAGVVDAHFGAGVAQRTSGDAAHLRLLHWLGQIEDSNRFVLYEAPNDGSEWTRRALRQADEVVLVATPDADPAALEPVLEVLRSLHKGAGNIRLLMLHPGDTERPSGTSAWLRDPLLCSVYHVRRNRAADIARVARLLSGTAVSLVLGGGGARGFAHLGVLRALEELEVPIDMIGGTSIGAPIAHLPAQGHDAAEALEITTSGFLSLLDYTLPFTSLLAGRRITETINRYAGGWDIEDLWIPYFCVSTSLSRARPVVHRQGSLAHAVRASVSIPGVLPPVPHEDEMLIDGGVLNNLPIDVMRRLNPAGEIIAVDVAPAGGPKVKADYGYSVSGWRLLLNRVNPFAKSVFAPNVANTIVHAMTVTAMGRRQRLLQAQAADLYLNLNAPQYGMLDFDEVRAVAYLGYQQCIAACESWRAERLADLIV